MLEQAYNSAISQVKLSRVVFYRWTRRYNVILNPKDISKGSKLDFFEQDKHLEVHLNIRKWEFSFKNGYI